MFDDFITQKQCDEEDYTWFDEMNEFLESLVSPYVVYEIDCDDGTHGDLIYIFQK